jgi:hypothetical protein
MGLQDDSDGFHGTVKSFNFLLKREALNQIGLEKKDLANEAAKQRE